jgi:hypothetical protein
VDDAGVEPGVADLLDPLDLGVAALAADADGVDPRPVQLLELLEPRDGALLELGASRSRPLPALALVERERQAEVAAAEMFQSPMLRKQSSIRFLYWGGVH